METETRILLFVCTGNYYRSRYAEYVFNARRPTGMQWLADSRGFEPSPMNPGPVSREAARRLRAQGEEPPTFREPIKLHESDLRQAALVVLLDEQEHRPYMHERFPDWEHQVRYWRVADLWAYTPEQALGIIDQQVEQLITELVKAHDSQHSNHM